MGRWGSDGEDDDAEDDAADDADVADDALARGECAFLQKWRNLQMEKNRSLVMRSAMGR